MITERIEKISKALAQNEGFIITSDATRQYVTGFKSSAGTVLITKKESYFFIDSRYFEKAQNTVKHLIVVKAQKIFDQIKQTAESLNIKTLYTEVSAVSVSEQKRFCEMLSPIAVSDDSSLDRLVTDLRAVKDKDEIECIKSAQSITDKAFSHILNFIKEGKTEREIALELEFFMRKQGSEGVAFDTIAVSGKNSSLPHGVPTDKPLENGDFITMDFGARVGGYCADMTRTVAIEYVSDKQVEVYETVLAAQINALNTIKAGLKGSVVDAAARNVIIKKGYGEYFGHALGHSLGLEVHEAPSCSPSSDTVLKSGMLMTVEPGIYIPENFGVRIEDMVLILDSGIENLTKSPKALIII